MGAVGLQRLKERRGGAAEERVLARPSSRRASKPTHSAPMQPMSDELPVAPSPDVLPQGAPQVATFDDVFPSSSSGIPAASLPQDPIDRGLSNSSSRRGAPAERPMSRQASDARPASKEGGRSREARPESRSKPQPAAPKSVPAEAPSAGGLPAVAAPPVARADSNATPKVSTPPTPPAGISAGRPMTAKKAPPKAASGHAQSRLRPPIDPLMHRLDSSTGVRVFAEDADGDDDVDIVQETFVPVSGKEHQHGALVSDMYKAKEAAEHQVAPDGAPAMPAGLDIEGGINLGRGQRRRKGGAVRADLGQMRGAVEALVQGIAPLARSMEYLQVRCSAIVACFIGGGNMFSGRCCCFCAKLTSGRCCCF